MARTSICGGGWLAHITDQNAARPRAGALLSSIAIYFEMIRNQISKYEIEIHVLGLYFEIDEIEFRKSTLITSQFHDFEMHLKHLYLNFIFLKSRYLEKYNFEILGSSVRSVCYFEIEFRVISKLIWVELNKGPARHRAAF